MLAITSSLTLAACAGNTSTPPSSRSSTPLPPGSSSTPPTTQPDYPYADAGPLSPPPPATGDAGSATPPPTPGPATDVANRLMMAEVRATAADCRCYFMEMGFASAAECTTTVSAPADPAAIACLASALGTRPDIAECWITDIDAYTACATTATCGSTTCDDAPGATCPEDAAVEAAVDACFAD